MSKNSEENEVIIDMSALYIALCYAYTIMDFDRVTVKRGYKLLKELYEKEAKEPFLEDILEPMPFEEVSAGMYYSLVDSLEIAFDHSRLLKTNQVSHKAIQRLAVLAKELAEDAASRDLVITEEASTMEHKEASALVEGFMNGSWIKSLIMTRPGLGKGNSGTVSETFGRYDKKKNTAIAYLDDDKAFAYVNRVNSLSMWFSEELGNYSEYLKGIAGQREAESTEDYTMLSSILEGIIANSAYASERDWAEGRQCNVTLTGTNLPGVALSIYPVTFSLVELRYMAQQIQALNELSEQADGICVTPSELMFGKSVRVDLTETYAPFTNNQEFERYDLSLVNIDRPATDLVAQVKAILDKPEDERPQLITGLFYGVPGSGKSLLANYLGAQLNRPVLKKTYADLQSMYVGEGEKNLQEAFAEAEATGSILLIDEIDSIAGNRQNAEKNYQKTFTNQLLTELDNFKGIFICTSNFMDGLDSAILRRLFLKIKFDFLDEMQVETAFKLYFPKMKRSKLGFMKYLTPGDFKAVREAIQFDTKKPTIGRVRELLEQEIVLKKKTLGEVIGMEKTVGYHL